ncbi:lysozyme inhibitor LprI family protein [Vreelandella sp. TE19]
MSFQTVVKFFLVPLAPMYMALTTSVALAADVSLDVRPSDVAEQHRACLKESNNTYELQLCMAGVRDRAQELSLQYQSIAQNKIDEAIHDLPNFEDIDLALAVESWDTYVNIYCNQIRDFYGQGSLRNVAALACQTDLYLQRAHQLWGDHLSHGDTPEPIVDYSAQ